MAYGEVPEQKGPLLEGRDTVTAPIRSVHIDIEGGFGGSSRSLFELVSRLDRDKVCPLVICRTKGPIQQRYEDIGIKAIHVPEI